jgi:hypothetical protein
MRTHLLPDWLRALLMRSVGYRHYSLVVAAIAFVTTITFSFPFIAVLIPAVLLAPRRWRTLGLLCGLASGCGAAVLVEIFQYLGWEFIVARYPELVSMEIWQQASEWLQSWGLLAVLLIAGSPMPQTPALLFCALADVSSLGILARWPSARPPSTCSWPGPPPTTPRASCATTDYRRCGRLARKAKRQAPAFRRRQRFLPARPPSSSNAPSVRKRRR